MKIERIREDGETIEYYMDNKLYANCLKIIESVKGKDNDIVLVIDGPERSGKSVLAQQLAKTIDPTFCIERMCLTPNQFREAVVKANKGEVIVFDEAFTGLSSKNALGAINKLLVELMMEMGQKNLVVLIVLPTVYYLEKYVALFRSKGLFHVYRKKVNGKSQRGRWMFFPPKKLKALYIYGKKDLTYDNKAHPKMPTSNFRGRFYDQYTLVESDYRSKKAASLKEKGKGNRTDELKDQRDALIRRIHSDFLPSVRKVSDFCTKAGFNLSKTQVNDIIRKLDLEDEINNDNF